LKKRHAVLVNSKEVSRATTVMSDLFRQGYERQPPEFPLSGVMIHAENLRKDIYAVQELTSHEISFSTGDSVRLNLLLPLEVKFNGSGLGARTVLDIFEEIRSARRHKGTVCVAVPPNLAKSKL
jgi:hypothetical protein